MTTVPSLIRRHPVVTFFVLAFVISWLPYPAYVAGWLPEPLFLPFGPLVAAVTVAGVSEGRIGLRRLGARMLRWRVGWPWWVVAVGLPLAVLAAATATNVLLWDAGPVRWTALPWSSFLAAFALRLVNPTDGPMGEEPGWRGFALPRMLHSHTPLVAAALLGLLVALWHLPLALMGMLPFVGLPTTFAITFVYCWLFNRTGGSGLLTLVFHATEGSVRLSQLGFTEADFGRQAVVYGILWFLVAAALIALDRPAWRQAAPEAIDAPLPSPRPTAMSSPAGRPTRS